MPFAKRLAITLALVPALAHLGCTVGPNYVRPTPGAPAPDRWHQDLTDGFESGDANLQSWWTTLDDQQLNELVDRAAAGNLDIRQAVARVEQARGQRGVARSAFFPALNNTGSYNYGQTSANVSSAGGSPSNQFSYGVGGSWEIDLFGRVRRSVESATASLEASIEDYRDVLVSVFSEVGLSYVDVRTFQDRIGYNQRNIELQQQTLELVRGRNNAGLVGILDVRQAEQNLANTESALPPLREGLAQAVHRLGVLIGQPPASLYPELGVVKPIPDVPSKVLIGLPAEAMRQRPDIRSAERRIAAQTAQIGVAKAELYPKFSLSGTLTVDSLSAASLFTPSSKAFGIGPTMSWNLFDGGSIRSNVYVQEAATEEAIKAYESALLLAYEDVENSLVSYAQERERLRALERAVTASESAVELVQTQYRTGLTDFQNVLDSQRSLFQQQDSLASSRGLVVQNLIQVYRAFGGGW